MLQPSSDSGTFGLRMFFLFYPVTSAAPRLDHAAELELDEPRRELAGTKLRANQQRVEIELAVLEYRNDTLRERIECRSPAPRVRGQFGPDRFENVVGIADEDGTVTQQRQTTGYFHAIDVAGKRHHRNPQIRGVICRIERAAATRRFDHDDAVPEPGDDYIALQKLTWFCRSFGRVR